MAAFIRGHMLQFTGRFIREDPLLCERVPRDVLERARRYDLSVKPHEWRPREELTSLWDAIARAAEPATEKAAYEALVRCGSRIGGYAATTFLKLLLRVMTPRMFASKFPDFYKRDHQGGEGIVEEIDARRVVLLARGVEGYDHFGPITVGWSAVSFTGMGLKNATMTCSPWSLSEPGPREVRFVATWE